GKRVTIPKSRYLSVFPSEIHFIHFSGQAEEFGVFLLGKGDGRLRFKLVSSIQRKRSYGMKIWLYGRKIAGWRRGPVACSSDGGITRIVADGGITVFTGIIQNSFTD